MYCLENYKNTSYKMSNFHIWDGIMNDTKQNPVVVAFNAAFDGRFYFECDGDNLYVARTEQDYNDDKFDTVFLSFKMREFLRDFNRDMKVEQTIMCIGEIDGTDKLILYMFEENWKRVYNNN